MSSAAKAFIRRSVLAELVGQLDENVEAARNALREAGGARKALAEHAENINTLMVAAKAELFPEGADEAAQERAKLVLSWLARAHASTLNFADAQRNRELLAQGMVRGYEQSKDGVLRKMATEAAVIAAAEAARQEAPVAPSDTGSSGDGERQGPGPSLKTMRQAEDAAVPSTPDEPKKAGKPRVSVKRARKG